MEKMKVFIGWSGDLSRAIATHLRDWIPDVIRNAEPWMSAEDLRKGHQWLPELSKNLSESAVGIVVLTRENLNANWILFEAGTVSKALPNTHCCTLLCDLKPTDVRGPLAQFQATSLNAKDMFRLMKTINAANADARIDEPRLQRWFDQFWDQFEQKCQEEVAERPAAGRQQPSGPTERELLEEILGTVRRMARASERWSTNKSPSEQWDYPKDPLSGADSALGRLSDDDRNLLASALRATEEKLQAARSERAALVQLRRKERAQQAEGERE